KMWEREIGKKLGKWRQWRRWVWAWRNWRVRTLPTQRKRGGPEMSETCDKQVSLIHSRGQEWHQYQRSVQKTTRYLRSTRNWKHSLTQRPRNRNRPGLSARKRSSAVSTSSRNWARRLTASPATCAQLRSKPE